MERATRSLRPELLDINISRRLGLRHESRWTGGWTALRSTEPGAERFQQCAKGLLKLSTMEGAS